MYRHYKEAGLSVSLILFTQPLSKCRREQEIFQMTKAEFPWLTKHCLTTLVFSPKMSAIHPKSLGLGTNSGDIGVGYTHTSSWYTSHLPSHI